MKVILASASPRRRELLALLVPHFDCQPTDIDESELPDEAPENYVTRLARDKALACVSQDAVVIAADTTVALGRQILGKPNSREHAAAMLRSLSGVDHWVYTGVAVRLGDSVEARCVATRVHFCSLDENLISAYLNTEEPWDKAGAYGIQGLAGSFVERIEGSYSAVVGLPLAETRQLLALFDIEPEWSSSIDG